VGSDPYQLVEARLGETLGDRLLAARVLSLLISRPASTSAASARAAYCPVSAFEASPHFCVPPPIAVSSLAERALT
jgi:hypothetical protein